MATWKKVLTEDDGNLATTNLSQSDAVRTFTVGSSQRLAFSGGTVQFTDGTNVSHQFDNANGVFDCRLANGLRLSDGTNTYHIDIKPKTSLTGSYTLTLPNGSPGGNNKILESDINGNLSWIDTPSSGGGSIDGTGAASRVAYWSDSDTLTSSGDLIFDGTDLRVTNTVVASELDANTINAEVTGLSSDGDVGRGAEVLAVSTSQSTSAARMYYINSSSTFSAADKDVEAGAAGFLLTSMGSNANQGMLIRGIMRVGSGGIGGTPTVGDRLYLGDSGQFTVDTSGFAAGDFIRMVGHYIATNTIYFNPSQEYIELA